MSAAHPDDLALAQQIAAGDEAAAATFFTNHGGELFGFARKMLSDASAAEDVLQEAMLGVLRSISKYDGRVSLRAWAFAILRHKVVDQIRKQGRDMLVSTTDPELENYDNSGSWNANQSIEPWDEQAELLDIVRYCMEQLPHNQREALHLRAIEGMPAQEVAEVLEMSYSNPAPRPPIRAALHRSAHGGGLMSEPLMPSCQNVSDALSDYLEGYLSDRSRISLEQHLEMCPLCLVYMDHFRQIYHVTGKPEPEQLPEDFTDVMGKVIRAWRDEQDSGNQPDAD